MLAFCEWNGIMEYEELVTAFWWTLCGFPDKSAALSLEAQEPGMEWNRNGNCVWGLGVGCLR